MINENLAPSMHYADIKAALEKAGSSQADIARDLKVSKTTVFKVIRGRDSSRRVADAIAKKIGKPVSEIWPGTYPEEIA